ncbi:MAG: SDR family oxidoreductase [Atopobiaceae bacterium]|nr:SDR family oxidoreductase [Atopobiaceae bacterium]
MNVVVSGTSSGIGEAIARTFVRRGHNVFGLDVMPPSIIHPRYTHFIHDIRNADYPALPPAHIVISSAGTLEERDAIEVNLTATMDFTDHFVKSSALRSVLFIASASARNGAEFPRYVASKAGIVAYMKNLALQLASRGVTCNSISPGGVITPANAHILESETLYAQVLNETLFHKWAEPIEIAELAYFLAVTNRSITGEDILVDNGEMLKSNFIW